MCQWFSCSCFFQSGACSHRHIKASWKPYVWELCTVCICYPTNPYSLHERTLSDDRCVVCSVCSEISWLCVYKLQHIIRRSGKMEGQPKHFCERSKNCASHMPSKLPSGFHTADSLHVCWLLCLCGTSFGFFLLGNQRCTQSSHGAKLVWLNVCFHRWFGPGFLVWFCLAELS